MATKTMKTGFPTVSKIAYEGPESSNPLSFRWYNPDEEVEGKRMEDHFRFAIAYWHTFRGNGADPFGAPTINREWDANDQSVENAINRVHVAFEFMEKLGVKFYCFHDRDVAPEGSSVSESNSNFDAVADVLEEQQNRTGIKLLWGTANLFSHPRYAHGAATSCNAEVFAHAAAQVKKAMEVTQRLGGENYVFWGGREGYQSLLNTDMKREIDNLGRFLTMATEFADKIGFTGTFLIEPKPKEPTKHQYDSDAAACINFLRQYGLTERFKLNIETNHATLAGHSMMHELEYAGAQDMLGSIDANTGDTLLGWDTDQFMTNVYDTTKIMLSLMKYGGFTTGGLNFDAKLRRESTAVEDLFHAHIGSMDAFAKGLKIAAAIRADGGFQDFIQKRYQSWDAELGQAIESGSHDFESLSSFADSNACDNVTSGQQEYIENYINRFVC